MRPPVSLIATAVAFAVLFVGPAPADAGSTVVQHATAATAPPAGGLSAAFPDRVTKGNVVVVGLQTDGGEVTPAVSDSLGSTFTLAVRHQSTLIVESTSIFYARLTSSGADTVTATLGPPCPSGEACAGHARIFILEVAGVTTTGATTGVGDGQGILIATSPVVFSEGAFLFGMVGFSCSIAPHACGLLPGPGFVTLGPVAGDPGLPLDHGWAQYAASGVTSPTTFPATSTADTRSWVESGLALPAAPAPSGGSRTAPPTLTATEPDQALGPSWSWAMIAVLGGAFGGALVLTEDKVRRLWHRGQSADSHPRD